jgi:putative pyruvate formate lyase activating enzyme
VSAPAYLALGSGELAERARRAVDRMRCCDLCARYCRVDRLASAKGAVCRTGRHAGVQSFGPHHGEERPLRGRRGSGTILFSGRNLRCVYCSEARELVRRAPD